MRGVSQRFVAFTTYTIPTQPEKVIKIRKTYSRKTKKYTHIGKSSADIADIGSRLAVNVKAEENIFIISKSNFDCILLYWFKMSVEP